MGVREGAQTALDRRFELIRRLALRQMHRRLRQRQQVLGAMIGFPGEQGNLLLAAFLIGDVARDL